MVPPGPDGGFSCANLQTLLDQYGNSRLKIASITACSNVTGIQVTCEHLFDGITRHLLTSPLTTCSLTLRIFFALSFVRLLIMR